jgi:hypothetical protein
VADFETRTYQILRSLNRCNTLQPGTNQPCRIYGVVRLAVLLGKHLIKCTIQIFNIFWGGVFFFSLK